MLQDLHKAGLIRPSETVSVFYNLEVGGMVALQTDEGRNAWERTLDGFNDFLATIFVMNFFTGFVFSLISFFILLGFRRRRHLPKNERSKLTVWVVAAALVSVIAFSYALRAFPSILATIISVIALIISMIILLVDYNSDTSTWKKVLSGIIFVLATLVLLLLLDLAPDGSFLVDGLNGLRDAIFILIDNVRGITTQPIPE